MSDIIVKFKPQGEKRLIAAINKLELAQGKATKGGKKFTDQTGRLRGSMNGMQNSLATVRSKLLLYNFAMAMGISQTIEFAKQGAKLQNMEKAFGNLTGATESAAAGIGKLRGATRGTVSDFDLLQQANNAMILGVTKNTDEMSQMFDMAKRLGDALGRDTASSVESLITGIGRQSRLMLDNIGIIVKSDDAYKNYARELNKTVDELTDAEKKQAFLNAAMDAARDKVSKLPPVTKQTSDQFAEFGATMNNVGSLIGTTIAPQLGDFAEGISDFINDLLLSDTEQLIKDLQDVGIATKDLKAITDALTLEDALKTFEDNERVFRDKFEKLSMGLMNAPVNIRPLKIYEETLEKMGATAFTSGNAVEAAFGNMEDLNIEDMTAGMQHLTGFMISLSKETAALKEQNVQLTKEIQNGTITNRMTEAEARETIKNNKVQIKQRKIMTNNAKLQVERLVELLGLTVGYQNALAILNGTINENNEENENTGKIFKTAIVEQNQKAILDQQLINIKAELAAVTAKENKSVDEKLKSDKRAVALTKQQIDVEGKLRKLKDANIDANLKAANAIGDAGRKIGQMAKANAQEMAALEVIMSLINAHGAYLKTLNSPMMLTNPVATKVMAYANLVSGIASSVIIAQEASKLGSSSGGGATPQFAEGGYVGGRPHSQGGTIIEAERGEFVMSRNATESIGLETLNQMNQSGGGGSINVSVTGNVLTQDFVEGELAESIKEAVRRGSDFGLS